MPQSRSVCLDRALRNKQQKGHKSSKPTTRIEAVVWSVFVGLLFGWAAGSLAQNASVALVTWGVSTVLLSIWSIRALK